VSAAHTVNKLHVGFNKEVDLPKGGYIYIADDVPIVSRASIFDPLKHSFNPLKSLTYKKAREIAEILYTVSPQGENTLTVRNGKRALLKMLMEDPNALISCLGTSQKQKQVRSKHSRRSMTF
jgi:hypothetical protein